MSPSKLTPTHPNILQPKKLNAIPKTNPLNNIKVEVDSKEFSTSNAPNIILSPLVQPKGANMAMATLLSLSMASGSDASYLTTTMTQTTPSIKTPSGGYKRGVHTMAKRNARERNRVKLMHRVPCGPGFICKRNLSDSFARLRRKYVDDVSGTCELPKIAPMIPCGEDDLEKEEDLDDNFEGLLPLCTIDSFNSIPGTTEYPIPVLNYNFPGKDKQPKTVGRSNWEQAEAMWLTYNLLTTEDVGGEGECGPPTSAKCCTNTDPAAELDKMDQDDDLSCLEEIFGS